MAARRACESCVNFKKTGADSGLCLSHKILASKGMALRVVSRANICYKYRGLPPRMEKYEDNTLEASEKG